MVIEAMAFGWLPNNRMNQTKPADVIRRAAFAGYPKRYAHLRGRSVSVYLARRSLSAKLAGVWLAIFQIIACGPSLPDELPALMELMNRDDMEYHVNAANKVAELYGKDGLLYVLENGENKARYRAARWLWRFPDESVEEKLIEIVRTESDNFLRIQAMYSLGQVGTNRALEVLASVAEESGDDVAMAARDALKEIRSRAPEK